MSQSHYFSFDPNNNFDIPQFLVLCVYTVYQDIHLEQGLRIKSQCKVQSEMKNEYLVKVIIIGESSVGKTNILLRYCENKFKPNYTATIGVDFKVKSIQIGETKLKMQIWDTAGQERYHNIVQTYFKGAAGVILTYSVSDQKSFQNVQKWMKQVNQSGAENVIKMLVGNKCDVSQQQRQVEAIKGRALADRFQIPFLEVSAKTGQRVDQIFQTMAKKILDNYIPNMIKQQSRMQLKTEQKSSKQKHKQSCQC